MEASSSRAESSELGAYIAYLSVIWQRKWIVLIAVVLVTALAIGFTMFYSTPKYQSSSELYLRRSGLDKALIGSDIFEQSANQPERNMQTAAELVTAPDVNMAVSGALGDSFAGEKPESFIEVNPVNQTDMLRITATAEDPQLAADIANTYATEYINNRQEKDREILQEARAPIEAQIAAIPEGQQESEYYQQLTQKLETLKTVESIQYNNIEVVKSAVAPAGPSSPKPMRTGILAFLFSMVLSTGTVLLADQLDNRVRSTDDVNKAISKPVLAKVPEFPSSNGSLVTLDSPASGPAEAYRLLKANLGFISPDSDVKTIMVTSPGPFEGKSSTVANLAVTMARSGQRVIVIEGDLRRPVLDKYFHIENSCGITNAIVGNGSLRDILQVIKPEDLAIQGKLLNDENDTIRQNVDGVKPICVATAGPIPPNPGELAASDKFASLLDEAKNLADVVLVDAPPIGVVGDAASLSASIDGVILIIRLFHTSKKSLTSLNLFMDSTPSNILGLVVNGAVSKKDSYYHNYHYYHYSNKEQLLS